ncbi:hypothetical protein M413DRAFT_438668 [Hebeloma cylindrosporum]|uniref:Uncharacterized protein n=1 Tax=Hebeloma cylindrosporum TaxID=76867 RepID=A0A0C3CLB0_HEBCY|nr:hypothetical protein M413DRAFT_438668 [Hebeloma cylindrosporum h7]
MSNSANGFINSVPGTPGRFSGSFSINHVVYNVSGSFATTVPEFRCSNATLKYDYIGDLTSTRSFSGHVGDTDIALTFDIDLTITGLLNLPIQPPTTVFGSAAWTQN